jgi:hypothetical protein
MTRILSTVAMLALTAIFAAPTSAMSTTLNTGPLTFAHSQSVVGTTFVNAKAATSDGTLTITANGDFDDNWEWFSFLVDDEAVPNFDRLAEFNEGSTDFVMSYDIDMNAINSLIGGDNTVRLGFSGNGSVAGGTTFSAVVTYDSVPEPATMSLLGLGAVLVGGAGFRRRRKNG